jgi:hypothetical protein
MMLRVIKQGQTQINHLQKITWPAIIHYAGEDELTFISNDNEWASDSDLHFCAYSTQDRLIDCSGRLFSLPEKKGDEFIVIMPTEKLLPLEEFTELVKKHLALSNECCISKIQLTSFLEGMTLIERTVI